MNTAFLPRFGKGETRFLSHSPLSNDAIRQLAPAVFAEHPHESRSQRYTYIPTTSVLDALAAEGFRPYEVAIQTSRKGIVGYNKHQVRLRHDSQLSAIGGIVSEVVLTNSHDGSSAYHLEVGLFVTRCRNGLVASTGENIAALRVPHKGDVVRQVVGSAIEVLNQLPEAREQARSWEGITLSQGERIDFATQALAVRFDGRRPFEPSRLLEVHRAEEATPSLWNTFNVIQENTIRGGLSYLQRDDNGVIISRRRTRQIRGIDQHGSINRELWKLASNIAKTHNGGVVLGA
jgi:Domain of unknown function (DUF932)